MLSLWCGNVTFNEHCVIDEASHFSLPNDYWSLFPILKTAHTKDLSILTTSYKHVCAWHFISGLSLLISSDIYRFCTWRKNTITEGMAGRGGGVTCLWTTTICDNSVSHRRYSAISVIAEETFGQSQPVMNETSSCIWYIFLISRTNNSDTWKWIYLSERTQAT